MKFHCTILAASAFAAVTALAANYSVSDEQLQGLGQSARKLHRDLENTAKAFDDRDVIPGANDRRRFREAMEDLQVSSRAISQELRRIQGGGTTPTEPAARSQELQGFYVVGDVDSSDTSAASAAHRKACDATETKLREAFGAAFDVFICGEVRNVTSYPTINYARYASNPKVSIRFRSPNPLRVIPAGDVAGTVDSANGYDAYASWWGVCKTFIDGQKAKYGARFVAAECGRPRNVTAYPTINYQKLTSAGTTYLLD